LFRRILITGIQDTFRKDNGVASHVGKADECKDMQAENTTPGTKKIDNCLIIVGNLDLWLASGQKVSKFS
jgi:hypothetical protein